MLKAELEAEFPFGVLLITDPASTESIPSWVEPGPLPIQIFADSHVEASTVRVVLA